MAFPISFVLSTEQVAEQIGLSISTLAKMRLTGKGPAYAKLGRRVVYPPDLSDAAIQTVLAQAEVLLRDVVANSGA